MKKLAKICLCLLMAMIMVGNQSSTVMADEDYSNSEYWLNRCTNYGKDDASACEAYKAYLESQNAEMSQQIEAWKAQRLIWKPISQSMQRRFRSIRFKSIQSKLKLRKRS